MFQPTPLVTALRPRIVLLAGSLVFHVGLVAAAGQRSPPPRAELTAPTVELRAPDVEIISEPPPLDVAVPDTLRAHTAPAALTSAAGRGVPTAPARVFPTVTSTTAPPPSDEALPTTPRIPAVSPPVALRFVIGSGEVTSSTLGSPSAARGGSPDDTTTGEVPADSAPTPDGSLDARPGLVSGSVPVYPPEAVRDGVEADVPVELLLDRSGAVTEARSLSHVGHGLDEAALRAVRTYRFTRGLRRGRPVRVRMKWTVVFRLD
jgi:periplasmic protein TonB